MPAARHSVVIPRPREDVFTFVADGENAGRWRSGVLDIKHVSGSGVGATYKQGTRGPGGRRVDADYRITAFDPPRRLAFTVTAGPVRPVGEYLLEDVSGATRLTFSLSAELGVFKRLFVGGMVQRTMDDEVRAIERIAGAMGA